MLIKKKLANTIITITIGFILLFIPSLCTHLMMKHEIKSIKGIDPDIENLKEELRAVNLSIKDGQKDEINTLNAHMDSVIYDGKNIVYCFTNNDEVYRKMYKNFYAQFRIILLNFYSALYMNYPQQLDFIERKGIGVSCLISGKGYRPSVWNFLPEEIKAQIDKYHYFPEVAILELLNSELTLTENTSKLFFPLTIAGLYEMRYGPSYLCDSITNISMSNNGVLIRYIVDDSNNPLESIKHLAGDREWQQYFISDLVERTSAYYAIHTLSLSKCDFEIRYVSKFSGDSVGIHIPHEMSESIIRHARITL